MTRKDLSQDQKAHEAYLAAMFKAYPTSWDLLMDAPLGYFLEQFRAQQYYLRGRYNSPEPLLPNETSQRPRLESIYHPSRRTDLRHQFDQDLQAFKHLREGSAEELKTLLSLCRHKLAVIENLRFNHAELRAYRWMLNRMMSMAKSRLQPTDSNGRRARRYAKRYEYHERRRRSYMRLWPRLLNHQSRSQRKQEAARELLAARERRRQNRLNRTVYNRSDKSLWRHKRMAIASARTRAEAKPTGIVPSHMLASNVSVLRPEVRDYRSTSAERMSQRSAIVYALHKERDFPGRNVTDPLYRPRATLSPADAVLAELRAAA